MQRNTLSTCLRYITAITLTSSLFSITELAQAADKNPSYDSIPITPTTWQEVDLTYQDIIHGKSYPASIQLLRPIAWLKRHGMHKVGNKVTFSIPEFGINAIHAQVTTIKPTTLNTTNVDWSKRDTRPVIGKFERFAPVVRTYTFKNVTTGKISTINATPNHPFYVKNKKAFVTIQDVSPNDQLVSQTGQQVGLVCPQDKINHCGKQYNKSGQPIPVYNLEVYQKHVYFVGEDQILVHNTYELLKQDQDSKVWRSGSKVYKEYFHQNSGQIKELSNKWNHFFEKSYEGKIKELATARVVEIQGKDILETPYISEPFNLRNNNAILNEMFFTTADDLKMTMQDVHIPGNIRLYKGYPVVVDYDLVQFYNEFDADYMYYSPIFNSMPQLDELGIHTC